MDQNECSTLIAAAMDSAGKPPSEILGALDQATQAFNEATKRKFGGKGEW